MGDDVAEAAYDQIIEAMAKERRRHEFISPIENGCYCSCGWKWHAAAGARAQWTEWSLHVEREVLRAGLEFTPTTECETCGGTGRIRDGAEVLDVYQPTAACSICNGSGRAPLNACLAVVEQVEASLDTRDGEVAYYFPPSDPLVVPLFRKLSPPVKETP